MQEIRVEKYGPVRHELGQLHAQLVVAKSAETPGVVEDVELVSVKPHPRLSQELKILDHGDDVLVAFPLLAELEVALDIAGHIGFERLFYQGAEPLFGHTEIGCLVRDVEEAEAIELPEEVLIGPEMGNETRGGCEGQNPRSSK